MVTGQECNYYYMHNCTTVMPFMCTGVVCAYVCVCVCMCVCACVYIYVLCVLYTKRESNFSKLVELLC